MPPTIPSWLPEFIKFCGNRVCPCRVASIQSWVPRTARVRVSAARSRFAGTHRNIPLSAFSAVNSSLSFCAQARQLRLDVKDCFPKEIGTAAGPTNGLCTPICGGRTPQSCAPQATIVNITKFAFHPSGRYYEPHNALAAPTGDTLVDSPIDCLLPKGPV